MASIERRNLPFNPGTTITEADRSRVYDAIRKELADVLTGDQSYYADGVQKDSQALASDLRKFISSMKDLQNRVDDPSNILGTAVNHLARYADAFQEVIDRSEPVDHIQIPPESSPTTNDKNEMYVPDLGPYSPPNPLSPDQWKKEQEASLWTSENTKSRPVGMISDNYPRLQRRGVSSTFAGNNPVYLAQPASSPQIDGTPANSPAPRLPQVNGNDSRASAPLPGAPAALFALPDSLKLTGSIADWLAGLAGGTPRNAIQGAPSSPGQLGELYRDEPVRPQLNFRAGCILSPAQRRITHGG